MLSTLCYTIQSHQAIENLRQMREQVCARNDYSSKNEKLNLKKKFKNKDTHTRIHNDFTYCSIAYKHLLSIFDFF